MKMESHERDGNSLETRLLRSMKESQLERQGDRLQNDANDPNASFFSSSNSPQLNYLSSSDTEQDEPELEATPIGPNASPLAIATTTTATTAALAGAALAGAANTRTIGQLEPQLFGQPYPPFSTSSSSNLSASLTKSDVVYTEIRGTIDIKNLEVSAARRSTSRRKPTRHLLAEEEVRASVLLRNPYIIDDEEQQIVGSTRARMFSDADAPPGTAMHRATMVDLARDRFLAGNVRFHDSLLDDLWIYMRNNHPFFSLCVADRYHPFRRSDRLLVLALATLIALILTGIFATQPCCSTTSRDDTTQSLANLSSSSLGMDSFEYLCGNFGDACDDRFQLCTVGSSCSFKNDTESHKLCVPAASDSPVCESLPSGCPTGWNCVSKGEPCMPNPNLVCYPRVLLPMIGLATANISNGERNDALRMADVVFLLVETANETNATNQNTTISRMNASSAAEPSSNNKTTSRSMQFSLLNPSTNASFVLESVMEIQWQAVSLNNKSGDRLPIESFSVAFSNDGGKKFQVITEEVNGTVTSAASPVLFSYTWSLDGDAANLVCETTCVLKICGVKPSQYAGICFQSDQILTSSNNNNNNSNKKTFTFSITTENAPQESEKKQESTSTTSSGETNCACGVGHTRFVEDSLLLALSFPIVLLFAQELVTFYENSKWFGLFTRRGAHQTPILCYYQASATRIGRGLLGFLVLVLCVVFGVVLARVNDFYFPEQKNAIMVLWSVMFGLVFVCGFVYVSILWLLLFGIKWVCGPFLQRFQNDPMDDLNLMLVPNSFVGPRTSSLVSN